WDRAPHAGDKRPLSWPPESRRARAHEERSSDFHAIIARGQLLRRDPHRAGTLAGYGGRRSGDQHMRRERSGSRYRFVPGRPATQSMTEGGSAVGRGSWLLAEGGMGRFVRGSTIACSAASMLSFMHTSKTLPEPPSRSAQSGQRIRNALGETRLSASGVIP